MTGRRKLTVASSGAILGLVVVLVCGGLAAQPPGPTGPGPAKGGLPIAPPAESAGAWSEQVDAVKARLVVARRGEEFNGTHMLDAYVELYNLSQRSDPILLRWQNMVSRWTAVDAAGGKLRDAGGGVGNETKSGTEPPPLVLPAYATLRLRVTSTWSGVGPNRAAHLQVGWGGGGCWEFERGDTRKYYLTGAVTLPKGRPGEWHGTLALPWAEIPVAAPR